jgi:hypothetical protein
MDALLLERRRVAEVIVVVGVEVVPPLVLRSG